jgi:hypothetical protein
MCHGQGDGPGGGPGNVLLCVHAARYAFGSDRDPPWELPAHPGLPVLHREHLPGTELWIRAGANPGAHLRGPCRQTLCP